MPTFTRPPNVPPEATVDAHGNWFLPNGEFITSSGGQTAPTAAQNAATPGPVQTDANGKQYRVISGQKWYLPPASGSSDKGGGLIHGRTQWNPQTGQYDTPLDWGKILTMVTAGIITAGAADALLTSTPALAATAPPGASASASAPVLEGVAAGGSGATTVPAAAGTVGGYTTNAAGVVMDAASVPPEVGGSVGGLSYADILRGVVPTAGNLVGGIIQANAAGNASAAQQKYLEEALAYQKESDLYNRTRQATLDAQEVSRYGDYQGRIAPFIANGVSSNDRMAALLGLPARAPGAGGRSGPPASQRVATDPATQAAIRRELQAVNSNDSADQWDEYLASHGDSATKNWDYWKHRIDIGDGVGKGYAGAPAPSGSTAAAAPAAVQMRAPDGSVKAVPADQVDFYKSKGASVLQGAA